MERKSVSESLRAKYRLGLFSTWWSEIRNYSRICFYGSKKGKATLGNPVSNPLCKYYTRRLVAGCVGIYVKKMHTMTLTLWHIYAQISYTSVILRLKIRIAVVIWWNGKCLAKSWSYEEFCIQSGFLFPLTQWDMSDKTWLQVKYEIFGIWIRANNIPCRNKFSCSCNQWSRESDRVLVLLFQ